MTTVNWTEIKKKKRLYFADLGHFILIPLQCKLMYIFKIGMIQKSLRMPFVLFYIIQVNHLPLGYTGHTLGLQY